MIKILCAIKDISFKEKLKKAYSDFNADCHMVYNDRDLKDTDESVFCKYDRFILDEGQLQNMDTINYLIQLKGGKNVIFLSNSLNNPLMKPILLMGCIIHYVNSPISSLVNKLEGISSIDNSKTFLEETKKKGSQKLVLISSASGGVGKTTLAVNLCDSLAIKGKKVLLVDMCAYSDIAGKLQTKHNNGLNNLIAAILQSNEADSKAELNTIFRNYIYRHEMKNYSFDILYGLTPIRAEKINSDVIDEIIRGIKIMGYDLVVFDAGSEVNEINLFLAECVDNIIVLTIPDVGAGWKLIQHKEMYESIQVTNKCMLVLNRYTRKGAFSCKQLERELQYPLSGIIPYDPNISLAANNGKLLSQIGGNGYLIYINYIANQLVPIFSRMETKIKKMSI